jgi:hypothetical protein
LVAHFGRVYICHIKESRGKVDQLYEIVYRLAAGKRATMDHQWDVKERVVQAVLVIHQSVVADVLAVVASYDEYRVFPFASFF